MGSEARRPEPRGIEAELRKHRPVRHIELPATLDGGDVVLVRRTLLVGLSSRTNPAGVAAMADVVRPFGYRVTPVPVHGCLHLKSACTALPDGRLLVNRQWIDADALSPFGLVPVPPDEPGAADVLSIGRHVCLPDAFPRTAELIDRLGFEVHTIDLSEFAKAEGGVTCLSLVLTHRLHPQN
jgi:dimethylargininase